MHFHHCLSLTILRYFIRLFLDQIFVSVLAILVLLAMMLIYSLLLSDVEEKTYECVLLFVATLLYS